MTRPAVERDGSSRARVAVIGAGIRGSMFATALQQNPAAELVALGERSDPVRDRLAAELGVPGYADVAALTASHDLDAVVVATPDFAHRDIAVHCAEQGLHLMIEKPLATTTADAEAIVAAAEGSGAMIMVGFENRWNPAFAEIHDQLAGGDHGAVVNQVAHLNDTVFVPTSMLSWAAASSPAWFLMPHTLDLTMWMTGAHPTEVFARGVRRVLTARGVDTWDAVSASFAMSDGSVVSLESQWVLPETAPSVFDFRYEINTDTAAYRVVVSDSGVHRYGADRLDWLQFGVHTHRGRLRGVPIDMIDDFVAQLNGADVLLPDGRHGLAVTRAVEAVHRSLDTGRPETITAG